MLAIGRSLMAKPRLHILDEPSLGLSPLMTEEIGRIVQEINRDGCTVILVEQNAHMALEICRKAYLMEIGRIVMGGDAQELKNTEHVRKVYLGA